MPEEATAPAETHPTLFALKGLFPSVDPLVLIQVGLQSEAPATLIASMGFHAGAGLLRFAVGTLVLVCCAQVTFRGLLCSVSPVMLHQVGAVTEGLATDVALVKLLRPLLRLLIFHHR